MIVPGRISDLLPCPLELGGDLEQAGAAATSRAIVASSSSSSSCSLPLLLLLLPPPIVCKATTVSVERDIGCCCCTERLLRGATIRACCLDTGRGVLLWEAETASRGWGSALPTKDLVTGTVWGACDAVDDDVVGVAPATVVVAAGDAAADHLVGVAGGSRECSERVDVGMHGRRA